MDAVEFIEARQKFCMSRVCGSCELHKANISCGGFNEISDPTKLVNFIEEWSNKNPPIVTNESKFKEIFGTNEWYRLRATLSPTMMKWFIEEYKEPEENK